VTALAIVGGRAAGVVAAGPLPDAGLGPAIARAAALPAIADIPGLFAWLLPDDTVLVDGTAGILRVNPPATTIARYRHARESGRPPEGGSQ
jgi:hypothetical protein